MRVIAQGTFTKVIGYNHLGYLAASTSIRDGFSTMGGLIAVGIGVLLTLSWISSRLFVRGDKLSFRSRHRRVILSLGALLILAGMGWVVYANATATEREVHIWPEEVTWDRAHFALAPLGTSVRTGKPLPEDFAAFAQKGGDKTTDGWFHEMRFSKDAGEGIETYRVTSAGPDGVFDTADDITYRYRDFYPKELDLSEETE